MKEIIEALKYLIKDIKRKPNDTRYATAIKKAEDALAQYNAATPQTPIDTEPDEDDQETMWDEFFDQIIWDERESNSEVNQIMKSLQRKYRITRK